MTHFHGLRCRECGADHPDAPRHVGDQCFAPQFDHLVASLAPPARRAAGRQ